MSWVSAGRRRCGMVCRHWRVTSPRMGMTTAGFVANLDYCSRETGLARGFAHYEDFPLSVLDTFNRYIALGRRIDASSWTSTIDAWWRNRPGIGTT